MRRWLAVLLLVLLPLQFSWAALADYCMHEPNAATHPIGHQDHAVHAHGEKADGGGDTSTADGDSSTFATPDCGHCHGHCAATLYIPGGLLPRSPTHAPPSLGDAPGAEPVPAQPERPQWVRLA